jgi:hypothetical protein
MLICRYEVTRQGKFILKALMHVLKEARAAAGESEVRGVKGESKGR